MKDTAPALEIEDLHYQYVQEWTLRRIPALQAVSLQVQEGESFGFLGHNGAGKTTTMKCVLGLLRPRRGTIKIFGLESHLPQSRQALGYVPEQPYFYDHLTVHEIMQMSACLAGVPGEQRSARIQTTLELVRIADRARAPMRTLSKGITQRVALAQALVGRPKLLLLDEPFSGLDPIGRKEFRELLTALKSQGTTIFMSSHILSDVEFLCDRVSIMAQGRIRGIFGLDSKRDLDSGAFELVVRHSDLAEHEIASLATVRSIEDKFLRLSFTQRSQAEQALRIALERQIPVESFELVHGNLEDLFVKLVNVEGGRAT